MFKQHLLESIYHFDKTDGIGNLSILWLLSLLPSQISSSTLGNAEARLKNEELYAGTWKQCHCSSGMDLLGQTNTIRKTPCPNEKIYGCCFSKTQNYASLYVYFEIGLFIRHDKLFM